MENTRSIQDISARSKFVFANSMLCLLKAIEGRRITVELRDDCVVKGLLVSVDAAMGLNMSNVVMISVKGHTNTYKLFYLQGRKIRYVHIPDEVDIMEAMNRQLNVVKVHQKKERENRKQIFDKKRQRKTKQQ